MDAEHPTHEIPATRRDVTIIVCVIALFLGAAVGYQLAAQSTSDRVNAQANKKIGEWVDRTAYWEGKYRRLLDLVDPDGSSRKRKIGSPAPGQRPIGSPAPLGSAAEEN